MFTIYTFNDYVLNVRLKGDIYLTTLKSIATRVTRKDVEIILRTITRAIENYNIAHKRGYARL